MERAMMYCPLCEKNGVKTELMRDMVEVKCLMGHTFQYNTLMSMNPTLIRMEFTEKAGPHDVKLEAWVNGEVLAQFNQKFPNRLSSTIDNILRTFLDGDMVIVDGMQAREMKSLGIKNGAEMLAAARGAKTQEDTINTLTIQLETIRGMFTQAGVESPA